MLTERAEIEATVRYRYRGHSQGALLSALHKAFEAIDQSPLGPGTAGPAAGPGRDPDAETEQLG